MESVHYENSLYTKSLNPVCIISSNAVMTMIKVTQKTVSKNTFKSLYLKCILCSLFKWQDSTHARCQRDKSSVSPRQHTKVLNYSVTTTERLKHEAVGSALPQATFLSCCTEPWLPVMYMLCVQTGSVLVEGGADI